VVETGGHWCLSVFEGIDGISVRGTVRRHSGRSVHSRSGSNSFQLLPIVYDTSKVFGEDTAMLRPLELFQRTIDEIAKSTQYGKGTTSSAFGALPLTTIPPGATITISTYYGRSDHILDVPVIARRLLQPGFGLYKVSRSSEIVSQITSTVTTETANQLFNGHVEQMFLDNSLRGGIPTILGEVDDDARMNSAGDDPRLKVYHLFSSMNGDLERDYNRFSIASTFFSQVRQSSKIALYKRGNKCVSLIRSHFDRVLGASGI
jgi:hypothetical protein